MPDGAYVSISRRFSRALIGVVTLVLLIFAAAGTWWNASRAAQELEARLASTMEIAETSLAEPLWNFDRETVASVLEALLLEESIVYADVLEPGSQTRDPALTRHSETVAGVEFEDLASDDRFAVMSSVLQRQGHDVGTIRVALSKSAMRRDLLLNIWLTLALTVVVIASIAITSVGGIHLTGVRRDPHQCSAADRHGRFAPGRSRLVGCPRRLGGSGGSFSSAVGWQ